ncbi:MAG: hypothetical protein COB98_10985 [Flavobacteriaceae bacterium]|nr:MAG: hypothetical protein COB98_10985 [Flavobacteriaceae bacterium]
MDKTFYLSDEAVKYQIDTTITSFKMRDNHGMTEDFYLNEGAWYKIHHSVSGYGNGIYDESFGVAYSATLNNYFFMFVLRGNEEGSDLEVEWNQKDILRYNFGSKKNISGIPAKVSFYDTLRVQGVLYHKIIEIDYSKHRDKIDYNTPVKTYISGEKGLIKFEKRNNVIVERVE